MHPCPVPVLQLYVWESYRLTGIAAVTGAGYFLQCTTTICDGQTPGTCAQYLITDTAMACAGPAWVLMATFAITAIAFWVMAVPAAAAGAVLLLRSRLHQEPVLLSYGWLYTAYAWYAPYWEVVLNSRRYAFVLVVVCVRATGNTELVLQLLLAVALGYLGLELLVRPNIDPFVDRFEEVLWGGAPVGASGQGCRTPGLTLGTSPAVICFSMVQDTMEGRYTAKCWICNEVLDAQL